MNFSKNKKYNLNDLYEWFSSNKRDLPFRKTKDPYRVWVSEVMLQQTRVGAVEEKYKKFIERFPDIQSLALSDENDVMPYWKGLGYYSRCRNLRKAAIKITDEFGGKFPEHIEDALSLPGIGDYTASAVLSIAWDRPHAVIDGNVKRVLTRYFYPHADAENIKTFADELMETCGISPGMHNESLMELGALICKPGIPECGTCPLEKKCELAKLGPHAGMNIPARKKNEITDIVLNIHIIQNKKKEIVICRDENSLFFKKTWFFPHTVALKDGHSELKRVQTQEESRLMHQELKNCIYEKHFLKTNGKILKHEFRHHITKYRITGRIYMHAVNSSLKIKNSGEIIMVSFGEAKEKISSSISDKVFGIIESETQKFYH